MPPKKRRCIIHCSTKFKKNDVRSISKSAFESIKKAADLYKDDELILQEKTLKIIDDLPDELCEEKNGFYRACYQKFTANSARKERKRAAESTNSASTPGPSFSPQKGPTP